MKGDSLAKLIQPPAGEQASTAARPRGTMATVCYGAPGEFNTSAWAVRTVKAMPPSLTPATTV